MVFCLVASAELASKTSVKQIEHDTELRVFIVNNAALYVQYGDSVVYTILMIQNCCIYMS